MLKHLENSSPRSVCVCVCVGGGGGGGANLDPNTKRFKRTSLIYLNTDRQYAHFRGNPLYQATKRQKKTFYLG